MKKRILKKREGFTLIIVLLGLALMSIFGIAIMGIATSNFKMTKIDSQSQGTYYIAEAGVNQARDDLRKQVEEYSNQTLSHDEFFEKINQYINGNLKDTVKHFEDNLGQPSLSKTSVGNGTVVKEENTVSHSERIVNYIINSEGGIGKSSRIVGTSINITHKIEKGTGHHPAFDYAIYSGGSSTLDSAGGAIIKGSIYGHDLKFEATNTNIEGTIISEKSVDLISAVKLKGNIYAMDGKVNLSNSDIKMKGDIHAAKEVTLSHGTTVEGSIYTNKDIVLKSSDAKVTGVIHSGGNIKLGHGSNVNNLYITGNVDFSSSNVINGDINAAGNVGNDTTGTNVTVIGDILSASNVITRANQAYKFSGNVHAAGNITNGTGNEISKDAISAKIVVNNGTISGTTIQNVNLGVLQSPLPPKPPEFEQYKQMDNKVPLAVFNIEEGDEDKVRPDWQPMQHDIEHGSYKNLILKWKDTAKFSGGNYYFNEIDASESSVKLKLDLSGGPINIYSKNNITFGSGLEVWVSEDGTHYKKLEDIFTTDPDLAIKLAGKVYWETHQNFQLAENCYFLGSILADNNFTTSSYPKLIGTYAVNRGKIKMGYGPIITYAPPTDSAAGGSGSGGVESDKGHNIIPQKDRITIETPIREKSKVN